jgi:hypothetical protein
MIATGQNQDLKNQVNQLIITLRKAAAQQKRLEESCENSSVGFEHRWSINHHGEKVTTPD